MPNYLVLMDAYGDDDYTEIVPNWAQMSEDQQVDLLNDNSQIIGMHCAGVYQAETEQAAIELALDNAGEWISGCVA